MGTILIGVVLGGFLVLILVVLVLLMNPPNKWVQRFSNEESDKDREREGR